MRLLLIVPCFLAALFVACGGGGGSNTPTPPAIDTTSPQAQQTAEAAIPDPFASLNSYNYDVKVLADGQLHIEAKGSVQAPDRLAIDFFVSGSDQPIESVVIIGNQAWARDNSTENQWTTIDISSAENVIAGVQPKDVWTLLPIDQLTSGANDLGEENVNGVASHHLQNTNLTSDMKNVLATFFGIDVDSGTVDIWRADDGGWPVKAQITAKFPNGEQISAAETDWEISNVNNVTVQAPQ
ncbi:MAG: hypothetical protein ABSC13_03095 [Dehalococcoidia bacterium]|jgi:hypothetical protein